MKNKKFYLSGPMSGIEDHNVPEFMRIAAELRGQGLTIVVPHELTAHMDFGPGNVSEGQRSWQDAIRVDLEGMMKDCTDIILMPGWYKSSGAFLELTVARALGFEVWFYRPYLCVGNNITFAQLVAMDRETYQ